MCVVCECVCCIGHSQNIVLYAHRTDCILFLLHICVEAYGDGHTFPKPMSILVSSSMFFFVFSVLVPCGSSVSSHCDFEWTADADIKY